MEAGRRVLQNGSSDDHRAIFITFLVCMIFLNMLFTPSLSSIGLSSAAFAAAALQFYCRF
jgi:hypothetical protein